MFCLNFTTKVLGERVAVKLRERGVIQTLRSPGSDIVGALLHGQLKIGDQMEVALDGEVVGLAQPAIVDRILLSNLDATDADRAGFADVDEQATVLRRAGYRFKAFNEYEAYRIQFTWIKESTE